ncbi:hypothetical protein ACJX0J_027640, partial [Zea mays]
MIGESGLVYKGSCDWKGEAYEHGDESFENNWPIKLFLKPSAALRLGTIAPEFSDISKLKEFVVQHITGNFEGLIQLRLLSQSLLLSKAL